jgi:hypothetical protein
MTPFTTNDLFCMQTAGPYVFNVGKTVHKYWSAVNFVPVYTCVCIRSAGVTTIEFHCFYSLNPC